MLKSLGKAQSRSVLALSFPGCLASWLPGFSKWVDVLLSLQASPTYNLSSSHHFSWPFVMIPTQAPEQHFSNAAHSSLETSILVSWIQVPEQKREGERENLTHPVQASKPRHPGYRSLESLWKALLRPGVSTATFQANVVTGGVSKLLSH